MFVTAESPAELISQGFTSELFNHLQEPGVAVANLIPGSEEDLEKLRKYWSLSFDDQVLETEVEALENHLLFGFKGEFVYQSIGQRLQQAQQLTESHGIDYGRVLQALYASNPVGQGIL